MPADFHLPPPDLIVRPARAADKDAVLAFTQQTWTWGDYVQHTWDDWLQEPGGGLIVGEVAGQVVGMDKLSEVRPGEGWFHGLRIHPDYRGRGYAQAFMAHQIAAARRRNLRAVRFLTLATNTPIHKNAARQGFVHRADLVVYGADATPPLREAAPDLVLRPLASEAAGAAWAAVQAGPLWAVSAGCLGWDWVFAPLTGAWWAELVAAGAVWQAADGGVVVLHPKGRAQPPGEGQWLAWVQPGRAFTAEGVAALATAAARLVFAQGCREIGTLLPPLPELDAGLQAAGWKKDDEVMWLFELML
jgi:RimJ/RimL family protein N-acetyltransferase